MSARDSLLIYPSGMLRFCLPLLVVAACGGTPPASQATPPVAPARADDPTCPLLVPGTSLSVEDTTTGAALVFRIDLQRAAHPRLFTPRERGPLADPVTVMESVSRAYPGHRLSGVDAPTTGRPTYLAYVTTASSFTTVLIDPVSAQVLGELPERSWIRTLQDLHYDLLGGRKHDKLLCYATGGPSNYPKDRLAAKMDYYLSLGFRAFKLGAGSYSPDRGWYMPTAPSEAADFEGDKLAFVRAHVGPDIHVMLDAHMGNTPGGGWDLATAIAAASAPDWRSSRSTYSRPTSTTSALTPSSTPPASRMATRALETPRSRPFRTGTA